jgi:hypothetical protein
MSTNTARFAIAKPDTGDLVSGYDDLERSNYDLIDTNLWRNRGVWSSATAYVINDVVLRNGLLYIAIAPSTNQQPPNATYWTPFAATTERVELVVALSDETTTITTGTAKVTLRSPFAFTLTSVRASLATASTSGLPTVDINEGGVTILSTKLTIDANEKTSTTAAAAAVISDSAIADDAELTFDIDVAGTGAKGLKVHLYGYRAWAAPA